MDNWSIPKYAENTTAAKYFIAYINRYEVAYENMWWVGSAVPVKSVCDDIVLEITDPWAACELANAEREAGAGEYTAEDFMCFADYFNEAGKDCNKSDSCGCDWHKYAEMYSKAVCPSDEELERAAIMTDFSKKTSIL